MSSLREFQKEFGAAVRGALASDTFIHAADPIPLERRVDVYRNNVHASLIDGLEDAFPVVVQLVGRDFFRAMAREYLRDHMPTRGTLIGFGSEMPAFLDGFPPVASLPYLSDVARFELAWLRSYHAADDDVLTPEVLATIPQEELADMKFVLHSSLEVVRSSYPVLSIWEAHQPGRNPVPIDMDQGAEVALLLRSEFLVAVHRMEQADMVFVDALNSGQPFGVAAAAALKVRGTFDLSQILHLLLSGGGFSRLTRS